jgi:hypothetical protein
LEDKREIGFQKLIFLKFINSIVGESWEIGNLKRILSPGSTKLPGNIILAGWVQFNL